MKTIEEISEQNTIFLNDWKCEDDVFNDFQHKKTEDIKILFASYGYANYSGEAFVLFISNNQLYEVNASHCSCYGVEGQWEPEKTDLEAIKFRLTNGGMGTDSYCGNEFAKELMTFIGINN